jgi:glutamyl-tRNA synthetase
MSPVLTRFAPSPTGFLHLGSARTALFSWAYARHHGGRFALRIEDTDRERSTAESETALIQGLEWLDIEWDHGPYRQSERTERHAEIIEELLAKDRAYRCICTREELEERKQKTIAEGHKWTYDGRCRDVALGPDCGPHTVRLRLPASGMLGWNDAVFGPSGQDASEIGDRIIRRADGGPLYSLAAVTDDVELGVTHVIRGADHHSNTPFHIALYRALEVEPPVFAHVPLIVGSSGKKLSKRRDDVEVAHYREQGYLPEALRNWLIRVGWSHGDQEIFSRDEIIRYFDLDAVGRASAQADPDKLLWLNQHYIKAMPMEELLEALAPHLTQQLTERQSLQQSPPQSPQLPPQQPPQEQGQPIPRPPGLEDLIDLNRERSKTLADMARLSSWFVTDSIEYQEKAARKNLKIESLPRLRALHERMRELEPWSSGQLESLFGAVAAELGGVAMGKLAQPVRVAVTGGTVSPGIFETLAALGKERSLQRIEDAIHFIERNRDASA